eukprot:Lankesteria_metandrocarpae@DN2567_c0_g1_i2.p1
MKLDEFKSGKESSVPAVPQAILDMRRREEEKKKKKDQLLMLTHHGESSVDIVPPTPDFFLLNHPMLAPIDLDIIKLTAQFVARNGQKFLVGLTQRERSNVQFEFLLPSHYLFKYFTNLVDCYTKCLIPEKSSIDQLKKNVSDEGPAIILEKMYRRSQWIAKHEKEKMEKEKQEEEERVQMQNINWHNFVVVESIEFTADDELADLPPPLDFTSTGPRSTPAPLAMSTRTTSSVIDKGRMIREDDDMEVDGNEDDAISSERPPAPLPRGIPSAGLPRTGVPQGVHVFEPPAALAPPLAPAVPFPADMRVPPAPPTTIAADADMDEDTSVLVVSDYKRGTRKRVTAAHTGEMQRCPITGQLVPAANMSEHLRILLLDPKWKEQKDKLLVKAKQESALAPEFDVEHNLAQFVVRRPDLFGSVEDEIHEHTAEDESSMGAYDPAKGTAALTGRIQFPPQGPILPGPAAPPNLPDAMKRTRNT